MCGFIVCMQLNQIAHVVYSCVMIYIAHVCSVISLLCFSFQRCRLLLGPSAAELVLL